MSSVGQAVGYAVGAVAGFMIPGVGLMLGAQIGGMIGGYIDPPKSPKQEPPATKDLTVQTATYGALRPRLYGTISVYGNIFWLENNLLKMVIKKTKTGGKGGGGKTTVKTKTYFGTFAYGLCDCTSAPIVGIRRIWLGGKLWYDAGSTDQDSIRASNSASTQFTLHTGSDTQLPDTRMQATLGIGNTPAYRGLAYIVFNDLPLAPYNDTLMGLQIKVEVVCSGTPQYYASTYQSMPSSQYWSDICWNGRIFCAIAGNSGLANVCATSTDGVTWTQHAMPDNRRWTQIAWNGKLFCATSNMVYLSNIFATSPNGIDWTLRYLPVNSNWYSIAAGNGTFVAVEGTYSAYSDDGITWYSGTNITSGFWTSIAWNGTLFIAIQNSGTSVITSTNGRVWTEYPTAMPSSAAWGRVIWNGSFFLTISYSSNEAATSYDGINWTARTLPLAGIHWDIVWTGSEFYIAQYTGNQAMTSPDGINWTVRSTNYGSWYSSAWNGAVICYLSYIDNKCETVVPFNIGSTDATLASIVSSEVLQSKVLTSGDIDVTLLASQTVRGYKVSSVAAIRSALEPLQGAWPFDVVHHGYQLQFKPRGTASVVTISESSLDARSTGDAPGVALTSVREMDSVLPRRVTMQYLDYSREYDVNTQYAERLNTDAVNIQSLDLAIVLTPDEAARIVEILLYMYWLERYSLKFSLPSTYNNLEPGDVVTVVTSNGTYALRLTQITYTADGRLECDAKYSRSATYTSTAKGGTPASVTVTLALPGDSAIELLDIPLLIDSTNQAGYVAALTGYSSAWPGGEIYRTDDGGATWTDLQAFDTTGSSIGYASNAIGAGRTDIFDNASVLQVNFLHGATFSSVTELAVLNGSNYFAYGVAGQWEIIAAKTCNLQTDGSYLLSDLLRGKKGTEWACGLHQAGDTVVALDSTSVIFVGASTNMIGMPRNYRGVTFGQSINDVSDYAFTYTGVNLECYAPVYLSGSRNPSTNDWTLTWIPRTRVGGEWRDYVDATMVEATESYVIEIYADGTYTTLKRTLTATTPTVQYTSANQVTDFADNQAILYLKVYQVSSVVGVGYPLTDSIRQADPFWTSVVLAMHMDGADSGTTFTDLKGKTITANGGAVTRTGIKKAGIASGYFNGTTAYLSTPDSTDFAFGAGDFTIECWVYLLASPSPAYVFIGQRTTDTTGISWGLFTDNAPSVGFAYSYNGTTNNFINTGAGALNLNKWYHVAVCRSGTNLRMFLDGVLKTTQAISTNALFDSPSGMKIGAINDTPNYFMNGYIDDVEITKAAKYTGTFFPIYPFLES